MAEETKETSNIKLIQLSNYVRPEITESRSREWVLNGKNNEFFKYVIDRYNGSPTNESVINVYRHLLYGKGIRVKGQTDIYKELNEVFNPREQRKCLTDYKMFGMYAMQLIKSKGGTVAAIEHIPINKLGMEKSDDNGVINNVYYCEDWTNTYKYKPKKLPVFNGKMTSSLMIKLVVPYQVGMFYYANPDYLAGLQYAHIEEEISNFSLNHILNGLSFGYIINFNNGSSITPEQKDEIERRIKLKLTGSPNAGKFIISFNDGKDAEVTIEKLDVNDAHNQWESLRNDAKYQILTSHGVTSPLLFGIESATGFGSNADELNTASKLLQDYQINPKQNVFIEELKGIIELNGLETDLEFIPLRDSYTDKEPQKVAQPIIEDDSVMNEEGENLGLSSHVCLSDEMEATPELADHLIGFGEELNYDDYELLAVNEVDYETDDIIYEALSFATSTGVAKPNARSEQDSENIVIRYRYVGNPIPEREFCQKMIKANKLYRKEDIQMMESPKTNPGFGKGKGGKKGYSIWFWKGGGKMSSKFPNGTCKHKWQREIYLKRDGGVDVNSPLAKTIRTQDARRRGYEVPNNNRNVGITPHQNKA
jgi:hypothetical protein